jgi:predicted nucleic acid-binding protein
MITENALIDELLSPFRELPVDRAVAERAGRMRRETGARLSDALIAATALEHGLGPVTRTQRDCAKIRQLRLRSLG